MPSPYVTRDLFRFFGELRRHNNREWFNENKDRYLSEVRDPLLDFIAAIRPGLRAISPHVTGRMTLSLPWNIGAFAIALPWIQTAP